MQIARNGNGMMFNADNHDLFKSLFLVTELTTGDVLTVCIDDIFEVTCFLPPIHLVMEDSDPSSKRR